MVDQSAEHAQEEYQKEIEGSPMWKCAKALEIILSGLILVQATGKER